jgi:proteasome alpha subunit
MSMPFYVAPEQWMKDKADFARKGIARGRALIGMEYEDGVLICAENTSATLRKINEIYDRIAFAGAGRYNEYDRLRIAGVRHADLKGYAYSRDDVDAQGLANAYAQMLGDVFTHEVKPMEVEILVAEVGESSESDRLFHILYDGTVVDESGYTVLGGEADGIADRLGQTYRAGMTAAEALHAAVAALAGPNRQLGPDELEVAALSRTNGRRAFHRLSTADLAELLASVAPTEPEPAEASESTEPGPAEASESTEATDEPAGTGASTGDDAAETATEGDGDAGSESDSDGAGDDT